MINVGLLGYGLAGRVFHAPFLAATEGMRLCAIATKASAGIAAQHYPGVRICNVEEIIKATDIDLVVVATPNESHSAFALHALDAGKCVVVDKPMSTSLAEAERMVERAEQRGLTLTVFQNRRWDDDFLTLRRLLAAGRLGEWTGFESRFDRYRPVVPDRWRERPAPGGGLWWDLGPHLLDQTLQLLGQPEAIGADLAIQRPGARVPDYVHVTLFYGSRRAILHATCLDPNPDIRFKLQGSLGSFTTRGLDPQEAYISGDRNRLPARRSGELALVGEVGSQPQREPLDKGDYGLFYRLLRDCLVRGGESPVTMQSALQTMRLLESAEESAKGRCVVAL